MSRRIKRKIPFRIFWNMKNVTDEGAVEFAAERLHCSKMQARKSWEIVKNISRGQSDDPHVRYDSKTGLWHGKYTKTLRESVGLSRNGVDSGGTIRAKYQRLTSRPREEVIDHIMNAENCDEESAERIFGTGIRNRKRVFRHDKETNTWRGALAPEPTPDTVPNYKMTDNQIRFRFRYGDMPKMSRIDAILWIADLDKCLVEEAEKTFGQIRNCTTIAAIKPIVFDHETGLWMGYRIAEKTKTDPTFARTEEEYDIDISDERTNRMKRKRRNLRSGTNRSGCRQLTLKKLGTEKKGTGNQPNQKLAILSGFGRC